jgi:hypothetical protein
MLCLPEKGHSRNQRDSMLSRLLHHSFRTLCGPGLGAVILLAAYGLLPASAQAQSGPAGYTFCAVENATCNFTAPVSVAFGANGKFNYFTFTTGTSTPCTNAALGPDPDVNVVKACFTEAVTPPPPTAGQTYTQTCTLTVPATGVPTETCPTWMLVPPPGQDWTITITFTYDFTNFVPCSATVTKGCISGFTWGYTAGGVGTPLKTSPPTICTGTTQPMTCTDMTTSMLGIGTWNAYAIANGFDNSGNAVTSTTATSPTYTVTIGAPANLTASAK